jgi:hypothetical protein
MARGIKHYGAFANDAAQDIIDCDAAQGPITFLTGTADVINPHIGGNYIITTGQLDAMTLGVPTVGLDDGLTIYFQSAGAYVHTLTLPSANFATGAATAKTIATWTTGYLGQGLFLRAYNGFWYSLGTVGTITFS